MSCWIISYLVVPKKLGYKSILLIKPQKCEFTSVKSTFTSVKSNFTSVEMSSWIISYLVMLKKLGYKLHILIKTQNCEFTSVKSTFTSVNWLLLKNMFLTKLGENKVVMSNLFWPSLVKIG